MEFKILTPERAVVIDQIADLLTQYEQGARTRADLLGTLSTYLIPEPERHVALVDGEKVFLTEDEECELQRTSDLKDFCDEVGIEYAARNFGKGSYGMHELVDRIHVSLSNWSDHIGDHPACLLVPSVYRAASEIATRMAELYQKVALLDDEELPCPTDPTTSDPQSTTTTPPGSS